MNVLEQSRGHGELGLRGNMKLFEDLVRSPSYEKRVFIETRPALLITGWSLDLGDTFVSPFEQLFNGGRLDVTAVQTLLDQGLTRVESLAVCRSTPGTFFYDLFVEPVSSLPSWDDGITLYDDGSTTWDQTSFLYIHLFDGSPPNDTLVTVKVGVFFSNRASIEAHLGTEKVINGAFENDLSDWALGLGNAPVTIETANAIRTGKSARWNLNAVTNNFRDLQQDFQAVEGVLYRLSALYSIDGPDAFLQVIVESPTPELCQGNGRDYDFPSGDQPNMSVFDTHGRVRRLIYDFRADQTGTFQFRFRAQSTDNPTAPATWDDAISVFDGGLTWDDFGIDIPVVLVDEISIKPIYRFQYHEPRITAETAIDTQQGARDIFLATTQVGQGRVSLASDETRFMERLVSELNFEAHEMIVKNGGAFVDGEELLIDDFRTGFTGRVRRSGVQDTQSTFELEDVRSFILQNLPVNPFINSFPNVDPVFADAFRRMWFGPQSNITPVRVDLAANDYGIYEMADPTIIPNGIVSIDQIFAYLDSTAAQQKDATRRILLTLGTDYSVDLALADFTILSDVQIFEITVENNVIDYSANGVKVALVTPNLYTARLLAQAIEDAMNLTGGGTFVVTYNEATHDFTIDRTSGSGNFTLETQTGPNNRIAIWGTIGFLQDADRTGLQVYTSEVPVFESGDNEAKHFLRADGVGTRDTVPGGDFTGVSGDPIQKGADIIRFGVGFVPSSGIDIDEATFTVARGLAPQILGIYIQALTNINDLAAKIGTSNRASFVVRGDGLVLYIISVPGSIPPGTEDLSDADFIKFSMEKALDDVHGSIRVSFGEDPSTGKSQLNTATNEETTALFKRPNAKDIATFLTDSTDAGTLANQILVGVDHPPRLASFSTKILVDKVEGQKVRLTRRRGIGADAQLNNELFRILMVKTRTDSALANIIAVEDL